MLDSFHKTIEKGPKISVPEGKILHFHNSSLVVILCWRATQQKHSTFGGAKPLQARFSILVQNDLSEYSLFLSNSQITTSSIYPSRIWQSGLPL